MIFLLDMDDTLLDFSRAERRNLRDTLARYGVRAGRDFLRRFHEINDALWKALERGEIARSRLIVLRFERVFAEFGIRADAEEVADAYYRNFASVCYPFAGARRFLKKLAARGRVYLVTNGGSLIQRAHVRMAGFGPYFSGMFISEEVGADKPSQAFADRVKSIEGYGEERAVWLGDSLSSDAPCARACGAEFVLFSRRPPEGYCGKCAANYREALSLMLGD